MIDLVSIVWSSRAGPDVNRNTGAFSTIRGTTPNLDTVLAWVKLCLCPGSLYAEFDRHTFFVRADGPRYGTLRFGNNHTAAYRLVWYEPDDEQYQPLRFAVIGPAFPNRSTHDWYLNGVAVSSVTSNVLRWFHIVRAVHGLQIVPFMRGQIGDLAYPWTWIINHAPTYETAEALAHDDPAAWQSVLDDPEMFGTDATDVDLQLLADAAVHRWAAAQAALWI